MNIYLTRIREIAKQRHIRQADLARYGGISQSTISVYYRDDRIPSADTIRGWSEALHVSPDYLLGMSDNPEGLTMENKLLLEAVKGFTAAEVVDVISYTGLVKLRRNNHNWNGGDAND